MSHGCEEKNRSDSARDWPEIGRKPYFESDSVRLYQGDCLEVMEELQTEFSGKISAVITSPPYAEQRKSTYGGIPVEDYPCWSVSWLNAARPLLTPRGSVLINIREHRRKACGMSDYVHHSRLAIREAGWFEVDEIPWIKPNSFPGGPNGLPRSSWERILWFSPVSIPDCQPRDFSKPIARQRDFSSAQRYSKRIGSSGTGSGKGYVHKPARRPNWIMQSIGEKIDEGYHPARFPTGLARQMVTFFDGYVLDPFAGSGTTAIAAMQENRKAILIEQSSEYCDIAARRIENAIAE